MARPVADLDKTDCRILKRLNNGGGMPRPLQKNRIEKLLKSGFVEETNFGELAITARGQLELARWRFRRLPKSQVSFSGPISADTLFNRIVKTYWKTS